MKVALVNAFPNLSHSAEKEFIERCIAAFRTVGHEAYSVITSDDIIALDPDIVIVTHEFIAKTTDHFTVGLLWSPTQFYKNDEERVKAIRSWDLIIPINAATRKFAKSIHFPLRHNTAVSDLDFFPSAQITDLPLPDPSSLSLAYIGAHWDGHRHRRIFEEIAKLTDLHVYGPAKAWEFLPNNYRGSVPFDGNSVIKTLNKHGAVLAVHKIEHAEEETPSMRVFEACSARCIVITEPMQPLINMFGDSIHYVDMYRSPRQIAQNVAAILARYKANRPLLEQTILRVDEIFRSKASLERLLSALVDDVTARKAKERSVVSSARQALEVSVIVRCGSRPLSLLKRAVASLAAQTYPKIGLIFSRFAEVDGFRSWLDALRATGRFTFVREIEAPGNGIRSAAMWAGLRAVETGAFCMLDDDDELFTDHIASLVEVLSEDQRCDVAYSGAVKQEEDGAFLNDHGRFKGELQVEIKERRALKFMDDFNLDRLLRFDNFILSHAWLARTRVLTEDVLDDPDLEVGEDMYFYLLLASRRKFKFSGKVSAIWNWRSIAADNSMMAVSQQRWAKNGEVLCRRLARVSFPDSFEGRDVLGVGRVARKPYPLARPVNVEHEPSVPGLNGQMKPSFGVDPADDQGRRSFPSADQLMVYEPADIICSVDFTRQSLPAFISDAHGLSGFEGWGCWTDGPKLTLEFRNPLPQRFTLHLVGHAHESNHNKPIVILSGRDKAMVEISATERTQHYHIPIINTDLARSLVFLIPNPQSPASVDSRSPDTRKLGIGLVRIDIVDR